MTRLMTKQLLESVVQNNFKIWLYSASNLKLEKAIIRLKKKTEHPLLVDPRPWAFLTSPDVFIIDKSWLYDLIMDILIWYFNL